MAKIRVLIADDHKIILAGLVGLLEPEFELVGTAEDGKALVSEAVRLRPDVVVVDISMPKLNGIEAFRQIRNIAPGTKAVFLTMHHDAAYAAEAFESGASAYVLKHSAPAELVTAIREAMNGGIYVTPLIAGELMKSYRNNDRDKDLAAKLTGRQKEILQLLTEGNSAREIAARLNISPRTVEFHKYNMMAEWNLKTSADLIRFAIKHGLVST
ncbi:MAG TPA: response regulator transcription factor [Candidatus Deferrimicrobiaceae bacterium]